MFALLEVASQELLPLITYLKLGLHVILLEKDRLSYQATGNTTAKITSQHGLFYSYLIESFGEDYAKQYLNANEQAIDNIESIIQEEGIDCNFERQDSYVFTQQEKELAKIKKEVKNVQSLDFPAKFVNSISLSLPILGAIQFPNQAQFHPRKYILGLTNCILQNSGMIYENTKVVDVKKEGSEHICYLDNGSEVHSPYVVMATKYPFINIPGFYFLKMYQETSYLIGVETNQELPSGMYINTEQPTMSFRTVTDGNKKLLLIGGSEHKTGAKINLLDSYTSLETIAKKLYPDCKICYRWNTEDCISADKIPYIGSFSSLMPNIFVATGFKKWGMTSSNVAANIITDKILGKENAYENVFLSTRFHPIKDHTETANMVKESVYSLLINKLVIPPDTISSIPVGEGKLIEIDGKKIGIYKDSSDKLFAVKPICSHLGCELSFNNLDKTWDCPCHGSRFDYMGNCIYGPSVNGLQQINIAEEIQNE